MSYKTKFENHWSRIRCLRPSKLSRIIWLLRFWSVCSIFLCLFEWMGSKASLLTSRGTALHWSKKLLHRSVAFKLILPSMERLQKPQSPGSTPELLTKKNQKHKSVQVCFSRCCYSKDTAPGPGHLREEQTQAWPQISSVRICPPTNSPGDLAAH